MNHHIVDRIAATLGNATTRRAGLMALLGTVLGAGAAEAVTKPRGKSRPDVQGPCGDGKRKANICMKDSECCTGICETSPGKKNKDGKGRCRCVKHGGACKEDRNCCRGRTCFEGVCGGSQPTPPPLVCQVYDTGDPSANGAALTAAIAAAPEGATISIEPGQYTADYVLMQSVTLQRCGTTGEVLLSNLSAWTNADDPAAQGRTIRVGAVPAMDRSTRNGGPTVTLIDISVIRNAATPQGGGVYAGPGATLVLLGATAIRGASQVSGGGVLLESATLHAGCDRAANASCIDNVIIGDVDPVKGNYASEDGGGILAKGTAVVLLRGNAQLSGNSCDDDGGGIRTNDTSSLTVTDDASITSNTAVGNNTSTANGGGIRASGDNVITLEGNARVSLNSAKNEGGGVWLTGDTFTMTGDAKVTGNTATGTGGGIWQQDSTVTGVNASSVTGNTAGNCNNYYMGSGSVCVLS